MNLTKQSIIANETAQLGDYNDTVNNMTEFLLNLSPEDRYALNLIFLRKFLFAISDSLMPIILVSITFSMGLNIEIRQIYKSIWPPIGIMTGITGQYVLLPIVATCLARLLQLSSYESLGCLILSSTPGGALSNFFTYWLNGDLALSIVMTGSSSLLAFGMMPLNLWIYSRFIVDSNNENLSIPYMSIFEGLCYVCIPTAFGMAIRYFWAEIAIKSGKILSYAVYILILVIKAIFIYLYFDKIFYSRSSIYLTAILLPSVGMASAYLFAFIIRRTSKVCRTIAIETGCQNMPLTIGIITLSFQNKELRAEIVSVPLLYSTILLIEITMAAIIFHSWKRFKHWMQGDDIPLSKVQIIEELKVLKNGSLS